MKSAPLITIAVPSYNQGNYLDQALTSIFSHDIPIEVFVMDGGSTDDSLTIIKKWETQLSGWRSHKDDGQSAAINEGIALGTAPYVTWLNSDDLYLSNGLNALLDVLSNNPMAPVVYGHAINKMEASGKETPIWVEPFSQRALARRCIICQPATLIRRSAWDAVDGLDDQLTMALDYDLWWRLYKNHGSFAYTTQVVAINRDHIDTKTNNRRTLHYDEAIAVVRKHNGSVPVKWRLYRPISVTLKDFRNKLRAKFEKYKE